MYLELKRTDGKKTTKDGYPMPLSGAPITDSPIIGKKTKKYPNLCHHAEEVLSDNEIRITCLGSGNPSVRRAQAEISWLIELGNGDKLLFDIGGGAVANLWSLGLSPSLFDKLFLSHLHLDHVGDFHLLYDAMVWGRNIPLNVWGPSGYTKEMGTSNFCKLMKDAAIWHNQSKIGIGPEGGMEIIANEFDYGKFSPEQSKMLIYDENQVKIYSFPVVHCIYGAVGYRIEWNGLSISFHGDGTSNTHEAEQARGVDVMMHEVFPSAKILSEAMGMPIEAAKNVAGEHTSGDRLGKLFSIAKPRLGIGYHYIINDDYVDPLFSLMKKIWDGPFLLAQDLTVINVTPDQIVTRMAETDPLFLPPKIPRDRMGDPTIGERSKAAIPEWIKKTII